MSAQAFAYSVVERHEGWSWRLYDSSGVVIAEGLERTRQAARERIASGGPTFSGVRSFAAANDANEPPKAALQPVVS